MDEKYVRTFENLLYDQLDEGSEVYASAHIGEDRIPLIAENSNVDRVVMFESQMPLVDLEEYFSDYDSIVFEDPEDYAGRGLADAEFVSAPGIQAERNMSPERSEELLDSWAEKSDQMVAPTGKAIYLDFSWKQAVRGGARSEELTMEKVHEQTENALSEHFDNTRRVHGEDFDGILAEREGLMERENFLDSLE